MDNSNECAEILRVGEERRDASPSIKGFLFQDLITIELILKSNNDDKIYSEWIEDIFIESPTNISVYQIKHYEKSNLDLQPIYESLFYQFVKFKLVVKNSKKEFQSRCIYYANSIKNYNSDNLVNKIEDACKHTASEKNVEIKSILSKCSKKEEREKLLLGTRDCKELIRKYSFNIEKRDIITTTCKDIKEVIYKKISPSIRKNDIVNGFQEYALKDVLLALAIQYVQNSYLYKSCDNIQERTLTKGGLISYIEDKFTSDENSITEYINGLILSCIDDMFIQISDDIDNNLEVIEIYKKIYTSTKKWLVNVLKTKLSRRKFLYFVCTAKSNEIRDTNEWILFTMYAKHITTSIRMIWKVLFDIGCCEFSNAIKEETDFYYFKPKDEHAKNVVVYTPMPDLCKDCIRDVLPRFKEIKNRPDKWYLKGCNDRVLCYEYSVNDVNSTERAKKLQVDKPGICNTCRVECMKCIDYSKMGNKECDSCESLFSLSCNRRNNGT